MFRQHGFSSFDYSFYDPKMTHNKLSKQEIELFFQKVVDSWLLKTLQKGLVLICLIFPIIFILYNVIGEFYFRNFVSEFDDFSFAFGVVVFFIFLNYSIHYKNKKVSKLIDQQNQILQTKGLRWAQGGQGRWMELHLDYKEGIEPQQAVIRLNYEPRPQRFRVPHNFKEAVPDERITQEELESFAEKMSKIFRPSPSKKCWNALKALIFMSCLVLVMVVVIVLVEEVLFES